MLNVLMSERTVNVNSTLQVDGRQIARASAKYINEEITSMNTRKSRLAGTFGF